MYCYAHFYSLSVKWAGQFLNQKYPDVFILKEGGSVRIFSNVTHFWTLTLKGVLNFKIVSQSLVLKFWPQIGDKTTNLVAGWYDETLKSRNHEI